MRRHRRHFPFYVATAASIGAYAVARMAGLPAGVALAANVFFVSYLAFALHALARFEPAQLAEDDEDLPVALIFLITLAAAGTSLAALFVMVNASDRPAPFTLLATLAAVPLGWLTVHIMAATHYAHLYWTGARGLAFPETDRPAGIDFIYFALTIGMTAQTSDVAVTTPRMRRLVTLHGVVSFFFNTVILAAIVNAAVSIGDRGAS